MATKKNIVVENEELKVEAPAPAAEQEAEVSEVVEKRQLPNPFKSLGEKVKSHWKGILIGAGAAAGAALLAYVKGRDSVIETLEYDDDDEEVEEEDVIDTEATEVEEGD